MIRKNIKSRIMEHFFLNPTYKLRVREIERTLKLPLPSVIRYCKELEEEKILMKIRMGDVVFYTSNRTNDVYLLEKKLFNIKQLYISGLVDYLKKELSNPVVIVFGSYSKGEDTEESDVDIYLETPSSKKINLDSYEKKLKRKIQTFRYKSIKDVKNKHLANNIINGVILNNYLEVFK
ncbi:nucleotidyltransferase domain-containing protein [Candidatus Woesearchaeota archaeon]|nr:nucleotidyltransferase domain-containing protein [Candidatus Woesearchaeota archaeon]